MTRITAQDDTYDPLALLDSEALLTYREVGRILRLSHGLIEQLVATGQLASIQVGKTGSKNPRRLFRPADVRAFINDNAA